MTRDNEDREAFRFWKDVRVTEEPDGAFMSIGIVVDARGVRLSGETSLSHVTEHYLDEKQELALYEALRMRFDEKHRAAVEQAALAKLSPLEQEALRRKWQGKLEAGAERLADAQSKPQGPRRNGAIGLAARTAAKGFR